MKCRDCPTDIRWLKHHKTGKPAPIETTPAPNGNVRVTDGRYEIVDPRADASPPLYLNHFATCPGAEKRRRR